MIACEGGMNNDMKDFLTWDYKEAKDLATSFLTLIAAVLVFTVTFSEKVVGFANASKSKKLFLVASWILFLLAIIFCGTALVAYYNAAIAAAGCGPLPCAGESSPSTAYVTAWVVGNNLMFAAGGSFVLGLLSLVVSAFMSVWSQPAQSTSAAGSSSDSLAEHVVLEASTETD
jgi:hypothetical protein